MKKEEEIKVNLKIPKKQNHKDKILVMLANQKRVAVNLKILKVVLV